RDAITEGEWTHAPGRRLAQSHATTVPPSNGTRCRPAVSQKAPHVYLGSYNTTFREQIYIRWCCIDLLRPPRLPEKLVLERRCPVIRLIGHYRRVGLGRQTGSSRSSGPVADSW